MSSQDQRPDNKHLLKLDHISHLIVASDGLMKIDRAIRTAETGDWWLFSIKYDPAFDSLRGDQFQALVKKFDPPK